MSAARLVTLPFRIGARTIGTASRRLVRIGWSLEEALAAGDPVLPLLPDDADGYLVTSVPEDRLPAAERMLVAVRQRYQRYYVDLTIGQGPWLAGLSGAARTTMRRKAKRLAAASGGAIDIARYRTLAEIAAFHGPARTISATTYQEKLLAAGLPRDPTGLLVLAADDKVRAWLLTIEERPVAYLCCTADGATLRYDHVGHDPAFAALSPGAVLQAAAIEDLFADRFARFDFTEGEGQHKRSFASGSVECVDLLLLRPTPVNRALMLALVGFDAAVARAGRLAATGPFAGITRRVRRAA